MAPMPDLWRASLRLMPVWYVARPLWEFMPKHRAAVLSERRRRSILQGDPEPAGDPEFS